jgi:TRAP-type C4-dicarboxylate transport system substrate-binding protein
LERLRRSWFPKNAVNRLFDQQFDVEVQLYWQSMTISNHTDRRFATPLWLALMSLPLLLSGCGSGDEQAAGDAGSTSTVVNLGGTTVPDTPGETVWLSFQERAEQASGGRLELRPLIYGQLGSEEQLLSGLRRGRIQFANLSAQVTSTVVPELALLYAPFLFDSVAEADFVYDEYLTDVYRELLAEKNLHLITWYEIGFHSVYGKAPIILPGDAAGKRFRVSSSLNARLFAEAIGADVIPLGFGEIVSSLQTGLIEAGENSVSLYARTGIADEAPEYTQTRHAFGVSVIVVDSKWWSALDESDRVILEEAFPVIAESRRLTRAQDVTDLDDPELEIRVHELTAAQREEWKRATAGVTEQLIDALGGRSREIYDLVHAGKAAYAASQP